MSLAGENIAILVNPVAGSGRGRGWIPHLSASLQARGIAFTVLEGHWPESLSIYSAAWIVGGDGTLNTFINRYPDCTLPLMLFPGGSGNDFHWQLYGNCPRDELIKIGLEGEIKKMDAGICNGKLFINGVGIGFDGSIAKSLMRKNKKPGVASYWSAVIRQLFLYRESMCTIESNGYQVKQRVLLVDCMNGSRSGGGFLVTPHALPDDGLFDVMIAGSLSLWQRLRYLPVIQKGQHTGLPFVKYMHAQSLQVSFEQRMDAHVDGEYMEGNDFTIRMLPGQFFFRVPVSGIR